jgi:ligand-binding sensor domain-containing protein
MNFFVLLISLSFLYVPGVTFAQDLQLSISSSPVAGDLYLEHSFDVAILNAQTPIYYVWDFGDNHVSFDANPVHAYESPGEYRVWLNVMDADGKTGSVIHRVIVRHDIFQKDQQRTYRYLSAIQANCIYWDKFNQNTAWIGSQGGLIRVNFENGFQQYYRNPLPSGTVQDICQMYDQSLWIATTGGLVQFNALTLEWNTLHALNSGLTEKNVAALAVSGNRKKLWVGTMGGGIFCWNALNKTWTEYSTHNFELPTNNIWDLTVDKQDNIWAATHRGLFFLNPLTNSLNIYHTKNSHLPDNVINVVTSDIHGHIWIGTWNQGLVRFNPINNDWKQYTLNNSPLVDNFVNHLTSSPDGHIWIAAKENGLLCLNPENDLWQTQSAICRSPSSQVFSNIISTDEKDLIVNVNDSLIKMDANGHCQFHTQLIHRHLPENSISCLTQSVHGDIWIGLRYKGLFQLFPKTQEWQTWTPMNSPLPSYDIRHIHHLSGGKIAVGTANGLALYDTNSRHWTIFNTQNSELPHNTIMHIYYDANATLWIGTMNGVARFNPATFKWNTDDAITGPITCLAQTTDGRIWAGTVSNGLLEYHQSDHTWMRHHQSNSDLPENHIHTIIGGQNRKLWIGLASKGLSCLDLDTNQYDHFHADNTSLKSNTITALAESQSGVLWIGTDDCHLYRFHPLTHEWHTIALSENESDISSIMDLYVESEDNLWVGTKENGLLHISWPQSLESPGSVIIVDNSHSRFSKADQYLLIQHIYQTFAERNFRHKDISLMTFAQEIDINGDYCSDPVIDHLPDPNRIIETITQWASERYEQNKPLFLFLLGQWFQHTTDQEQSYFISENSYLTVSQLHDAISIYEQKTSGEVIVIIDGKGSASRLGHLSSKGRVVILSDSDPLNQENVYASFLPGFLTQISNGQSVYQSFIEAKKQASNWMYHSATPLLDDNGDGVYTELDGSFARQVQIVSPHTNYLEQGIQDVLLSSVNADGVSITILCNLPLAQIKAHLISLSDDNTSISIFPLETCRISSYCGSTQGTIPSGNYELIVMANDYQGHMIVSEPKIVQIGSQDTGSIWGKVNLMLGSHEISFQRAMLSVYLKNTDWQSMIHSDGTYSMSNIPEGTYEMYIDGPGFSILLSDNMNVSAGTINQVAPISVDIASSWCSMDNDCDGKTDLRDVIYLLKVLAE